MCSRRHQRHGEATRAAVRAWGLEIVCAEPREYSQRPDRVFMPEGHDADRFRRARPGKFRHVARSRPVQTQAKCSASAISGSFNDLMLMGTLCGVEMGLGLAKVPHRGGGVLAAMEVLKGRDVVSMQKAAVA